MMFLVSTKGGVVRKAVEMALIRDALVVWDRSDSYISDAHNIHTHIALENRVLFESKILSIINSHTPRIIISFLTRTLSSDFLGKVGVKILNFHPSVLPRFPGLNSIRQQLDFGIENLMIGATVHEVIDLIDAGEIYLQTCRHLRSKTEIDLKSEIFKQQLLMLAVIGANITHLRDQMNKHEVQELTVKNSLGLNFKGKKEICVDASLMAWFEDNWHTL
jgi:folate-dependent phosphoribosylglycinamide formyltransferase PurN